MQTRAIILLLAFGLDALLGDPAWLPHPICWIGKLIAKTEAFLRHKLPVNTTPTQQARAELCGGVCLVLVVTLTCFLLPFGLLYLCYRLNFWLGAVVETYCCFQIFAAKSLQRAALAVYAPLTKGDLPEARKQVSYIVGRDTAALSTEGVIKATVETVAENTTDGVIAPLLFMAIGGAPLAFLYKSINTMDSMVGYKNKSYLYFGRCAAILDDIANYIPARLSAYSMVAAAYLLHFDGKNAWRIYQRDRHNHKSPNSAQTESVCAGALGVQLAGNASYFGTLTQKPTIGDATREITPEDIKGANALMYLCAALLVCATALILLCTRGML